MINGQEKSHCFVPPFCDRINRVKYREWLSMSDKIDQVFDLLEKVYTELQDTKKELKTDIHRIETIIENEIKPDIKTLYELQIQTNKKLEEHDRRFDTLETKVDALSAKTLRHSYDIGALKRREDRKI
jgi:gas vesicle protein